MKDSKKRRNLVLAFVATTGVLVSVLAVAYDQQTYAVHFDPVPQFVLLNGHTVVLNDGWFTLRGLYGTQKLQYSFGKNENYSCDMHPKFLDDNSSVVVINKGLIKSEILRIDSVRRL